MTLARREETLTSIASGELVIAGCVERPLRLSARAIRETFWMAECQVQASEGPMRPRGTEPRGSNEQPASMRCWAGVPLPVLVCAARPQSQARRAHLLAAEERSVVLGLETIGDAGDPLCDTLALLLYAVDDAPVCRAEGGPLRVVLPCSGRDTHSRRELRDLRAILIGA